MTDLEKFHACYRKQMLAAGMKAPEADGVVARVRHELGERDASPAEIMPPPVNKSNGMLAWPDGWPIYKQACFSSWSDRCDMLVGPCACGASHSSGEFKLFANGVLTRNGKPVPTISYASPAPVERERATSLPETEVRWYRHRDGFKDTTAYIKRIGQTCQCIGWKGEFLSNVGRWVNVFDAEVNRGVYIEIPDPFRDGLPSEYDPERRHTMLAPEPSLPASPVEGVHINTREAEEALDDFAVETIVSVAKQVKKGMRANRAAADVSHEGGQEPWPPWLRQEPCESWGQYHLEARQPDGSWQFVLQSNSKAIERAVEALRRIPQLEAEVERRGVVDSLPKCNCGRIATCYGQYDDHEGFSCDVCCDHGCEDGWCTPIDQLPVRLKTLRTRAETAEAQLDAANARIGELEAEIARVKDRCDECWGAANYRVGYIGDIMRSLGMPAEVARKPDSHISEACELAESLTSQLTAATSRLAECEAKAAAYAWKGREAFEVGFAFANFIRERTNCTGRDMRRFFGSDGHPEWSEVAGKYYDELDGGHSSSDRCVVIAKRALLETICCSPPPPSPPGAAPEREKPRDIENHHWKITAALESIDNCARLLDAMRAHEFIGDEAQRKTMTGLEHASNLIRAMKVEFEADATKGGDA
jgi:hypothetical protein